MKTVIDPLIAVTGWTGTNATVEATTWPEFAASYLTGQLRMTFQQNGTMVKNYTVDVSGMTYLAFNVIASKADRSDDIADKRLKVKFEGNQPAKEFYIDLTNDFDQIGFRNDFASITKVTFTAVSACDIFISELIAYKDTMPYDGQSALNQILSQARDDESLQIGTLTANIGDTEIETDADYLDKFMCFKVGSEVHQVLGAEQAGLDVTGADRVARYKLGTYSSGSEMVANHTDATLYLFIPVTDADELEDLFPSIKIAGGFEVEPVEEIEYYSPLNDSRTVDTIQTQDKAKYYRHVYEIEGSARQSELLESISRIMRKGLTSRSYVWMNGRRHEIDTETIMQVPYGDATDIYNKLRTTVKITAGEYIWARETQTTDLTNNLTVGVIVP